MGLIVGGERLTDRCEVLWLQSPDWYADIRTPVRSEDTVEAGPVALFSSPWAFAGVASWDPPTMTWDHHLDSRLEAVVDANRLDKEGSLLIERGVVAFDRKPLHFVEEWEKISSPADPVSAEGASGRIRVTVGRWRITVSDDRPGGTFLAVREERRDGEWVRVAALEVGNCGHSPGAPSLL